MGVLIWILLVMLATFTVMGTAYLSEPSNWRDDNNQDQMGSVLILPSAAYSKRNALSSPRANTHRHAFSSTPATVA